jgi:vacuolar protein sorting-associated protein 53
MLTPHRGAKSRPSLDGVQRSALSSDPDNPLITVLPSSTELFFFYAQNLEQCAKLSTKGMLAEMFGVWGKWLRIYAGLCVAYQGYLRCCLIQCIFGP